jgi:hypothetical protein
MAAGGRPIPSSDRVERLQPDIQYGAFLMPSLVHVAGQGTCKWKVDEDEGTIVYTPQRGDSAVIARLKERGQGYLAAKPLKRKNENGEVYDLTVSLMNEMMFFPFATHDDLVDVCSRIYDMDVVAPSRVEQDTSENERVPEDV